MRDPNRIEPFLQELGKIWKEECPDWRFGQLIFNVFDRMPSDCYLPFHMEEDKTLEYFKKYFGREEKKDG